MQKSTPVLPILAIFMTVLLWGLSYPVTKALLAHLLPVEIAFFRFTLAALFLLAINFWRKPQAVEKKDYVRLAAGGAVGIPLYFIFENNGINLTTAGMASMIIATIPVLNALAGVLFLKERSTPRRWAGVFLSFLGVYLIVSFGLNLPGGGSDTLRGNMLMLLAAFTWVAFTRINAPLLKKYDSPTVNLYQISIGATLLALLALPGGVNVQAFSWQVVISLLYLGLFCSALAYFFYMYALKNLGATPVTTFINLIPVFGVLGGVLFLGEVVMPGQILGGGVVILGVTLVTLPQGHKPQTLPASLPAATGENLPQ
jgi:drug/metabolite transporter (DMT)-like permease